MNDFYISFSVGSYTNAVEATLRTENRNLMNALMNAIEQTYELWYQNKLEHGEVIEVRAV